MNDPVSTKEAIREHALALGFDDCRVTTAEPPASLPQFERWIDSGQHGEMAYLDRGRLKRADLNRVLPGARSVIVLAINYDPDRKSVV